MLLIESLLCWAHGLSLALFWNGALDYVLKTQITLLYPRHEIELSNDSRTFSCHTPSPSSGVDTWAPRYDIIASIHSLFFPWIIWWSTNIFWQRHCSRSLYSRATPSWAACNKYSKFSKCSLFNKSSRSWRSFNLFKLLKCIKFLCNLFNLWSLHQRCGYSKPPRQL